MSLSVEAKTRILNQILRGSSQTFGSPYSTIGTIGGTEVLVGGSSIREAATYGAASGGASAMSTPIEFPVYDSGTWVPSAINTFQLYSAETGGVLLAEDDASSTFSVANGAIIRQVTSTVRVEGGTGVTLLDSYANSILEQVLRGGAEPAGLRYLRIAVDGTELTGGSYAPLDVESEWSAPSASGGEVSVGITGLLFSASVDYAGGGVTPNEIWLSSTTSGAPEIVTTIPVEDRRELVNGLELRVSPTVSIT